MKLTNIDKEKVLEIWAAIKPEFDKEFAKQIEVDIKKVETSEEVRVIYRTLRAKNAEVKTRRRIRKICLDIFERFLQAIGITV